MLTFGLSDELFSSIKHLLVSNNIILTPSLTVRDTSHLLTQKTYHLLIVDLEYLRSIGQADWLTGIRRINFIPVIVLSDTPEQDTHTMVELGADICVSGKQYLSVVADLAFAQARRYTEYNHYRTPPGIAPAPFQVGDILIDPANHIAEIRGRPVNLRPREFSLLQFFMENPKRVLTPAQICEHAWGVERSYNRGVAHPVYLLRQAIEPRECLQTQAIQTRMAARRVTAKNKEARFSYLVAKRRWVLNLRNRFSTK